MDYALFFTLITGTVMFEAGAAFYQRQPWVATGRLEAFGSYCRPNSACFFFGSAAAMTACARLR